MKTKLLLLVILCLATAAIYAQHDYSQDVIVLFKEGMKSDKAITKGEISIFESNKLKSFFQRKTISETAIKRAMPYFEEKDTIVRLPDGKILNQSNMSKLYRIKVPKNISKQNLIDSLNNLPEVVYAESDVNIVPLATPNDLRYNQQWSLHNNFNVGCDINAEAAWDIYNGSSQSIIAIIDGGLDNNHPDLSSKVVGGDTGYSWNGHGVHVAGIAAAASNNSTGIAGVDWNAGIYPKRIDNASATDVYNAIVSAVNYSPNLHVLNCIS